MLANYSEPVSKLLTLGEPGGFGGKWRDYRALGVGPAHVPDLIRMATDMELNQVDSESAEVWAPTHAWRALGQLRAEEAADPLVRFLATVDDVDDWAHEELPEVLGMIGPPAVAPLVTALTDPSVDLYQRAAMAHALREVARVYPDQRGRCVAVLTEQLDPAQPEDAELNSFLIDELIQLKAVESADAIERAFAAGAVDESIVGDWPAVQYELGLTDEPPPGARRPDFVPAPWPSDFRPPSDKTKKAKAKAKRKQAAKSRKRNRKRR